MNEWRLITRWPDGIAALKIYLKIAFFHPFNVTSINVHQMRSHKNRDVTVTSCKTMTILIITREVPIRWIVCGMS